MEDLGQQCTNMAHTNSKIDRDSFFISNFDCRFPGESGAALIELLFKKLIIHIISHAMSEGDGSPWMFPLGLPLDSKEAPWAMEIHGQQESPEEVKKTFRQSNLWRPWSLQSSLHSLTIYITLHAAWFPKVPSISTTWRPHLQSYLLVSDCHFQGLPSRQDQGACTRQPPWAKTVTFP